MSTLSWATFEGLPGAATANFELLCRSIVRRHYGQFGSFRALANQPGVEFHLRLDASCSLGVPGRWYGWQCRWYDLPSGASLGATRRRKIREAIETTEEVLPGITDWVLWTRHVLTRTDQKWFFGLKTKMKLALWSAIEVADHLSGPAEILRESYFGELVLTPQTLSELHEQVIHPIRNRWRPEVHQVVEAERKLYRALGDPHAWSILQEIKARLDQDVEDICANLGSSVASWRPAVDGLVEHARAASLTLDRAHTALRGGQYEVIHDLAASSVAPDLQDRDLPHSLRARRHRIGLFAANAIADMLRGYRAILALDRALKRQLIFVMADAGCGKTQLAAQITASNQQRPAGILLRGRFLSAGESLNDLARNITIRGKPVQSFEALISAINAAAQRAGTRLPIVIDGLNESEDPRDWKDQLASLSIVLASYDNVQLICTLRSAFADQTLPEGSHCLQISGFEGDLRRAIGRYFTYYRIEPLDAELPWELLNHPLTLRIFCEVTNGDRKQTVGATAIPASLTVLFERYLDQVATRIAELASPSFRHFPADVASALERIGLSFWEGRSRDIEITRLRELLHDQGRPWDQSLVAALENDGLLFREPGERLGRGRMSISFDALAGHIVADALISSFSGDRFDRWVGEAETRMALGADVAERHPLATDVFRSLVGLVPRRMNRKQFWTVLDGQMRTDALVEAAFLDNLHLDQETVKQLIPLVRQPTGRYRDLLRRLFVTRAAQAHPLSAQFLDDVLRPMSMADRDLRWSEWLRIDQAAASGDSERLAERWKRGDFRERADGLRARWVMWTLTSTVRAERDHSTHALYRFGHHDPDTLFALSLESLNINDRYVSERMLAACYGVAMSLWADPRGEKVREALPGFANKLVDGMFVEGAPHSTVHVLTRDYALGVIALASKIDSNAVVEEKRKYLTPPFHQPSPFIFADDIEASEIAGAAEAFHTDFENYTLGRLISDRRNYDFDNKTYKEVRRQIEYRMVQLGYSPTRFRATDGAIMDMSLRGGSRARSKVDRYGKKYSWIAFFEMYGVRLDQGDLPKWDDQRRPSDVDIDPSFPQEPKSFQPSLADLFDNAPIEPQKWLLEGPIPNYDGLLLSDEVDTEVGPWLLVEGFVDENAPLDDREVFSFLRGVLVQRKDKAELLEKFRQVEYPGNSAVPEPWGDHYTYAGEIPWSNYFAPGLRQTDGKAKPNLEEAFVRYDGGRQIPGVSVEIPAHRFSWESYHSELNQVSGTILLAPALCEKLDLVNHHDEWDLYERSGRRATIYREFNAGEKGPRSHLLYIRADLMTQYLSTELELVWLVWGERNFHFTAANPSLRDAFAKVGHDHIHRYARTWQPEASGPKGTQRTKSQRAKKTLR